MTISSQASSLREFFTRFPCVAGRFVVCGRMAVQCDAERLLGLSMIFELGAPKEFIKK
jgi:hypothetical protein